MDCIVANAQIDQYARRRQYDVAKFWRRLGGMPDFRGKDVLDVGCGLGGLAFGIAEAGARRVVGVDICSESIRYANRLLDSCPPEQRDILSFVNADPRELDPAERFDCIVSRDVLEHVMDLPQLFDNLVERLRPGGRLYIGFGPLYRGPFGGHRRMCMPIPWGHLILPESLLIWWVNRHRMAEAQVRSIKQMGLNQLTLNDYRRILINESGLKPILWKVNHGQRLVSRVFSTLYRIPLVGELFANDIYAVLEKVAKE